MKSLLQARLSKLTSRYLLKPFPAKASPTGETIDARLWVLGCDVKSLLQTRISHLVPRI